MQSWAETLRDVEAVSTRQIFFIGGAPRSGTTWLQQILDAHPGVSCKGEGFFLNQLALPMEKLFAERAQALQAKNTALFNHTGGYPLPSPQDAAFLTGTAIMLALHRQNGDKKILAIGEKTPENVFFFPTLSQLFPTAKFISIARDPRDVLTSAWHFFQPEAARRDDQAAKAEFVRSALPSLNQGARQMLEFGAAHPARHQLVTYEALLDTPTREAISLFRFLGVPHDDATASACLAQTSFEAQTGGRAPGVARNGAFHRQGVAGGWQSTLPPEMNDLILKELGWMFSHFGWNP